MAQPTIASSALLQACVRSQLTVPEAITKAYDGRSLAMEFMLKSIQDIDLSVDRTLPEVNIPIITAKCEEYTQSVAMNRDNILKNMQTIMEKLCDLMINALTQPHKEGFSLNAE